MIGEEPSNLLNSYLYNSPDATKSPIELLIPNGLVLLNLILLFASGPVPEAIALPFMSSPSPLGPPVLSLFPDHAGPPETTSMIGGISGIYAPSSMFNSFSIPGSLPLISKPSPSSVVIVIPGSPPPVSNEALKYGKPLGSLVL